MIPCDIPGAWMGRDRLGGDAQHAVFVDNHDNSIWVEPRYIDDEDGPWVVQIQDPNAYDFDRKTFPSRRAAFDYAESFMYENMHGLGADPEFDMFGGGV